MSNKIVPQTYRAVIDDVIAAIKPEFDEYGVSEEVLAELQHKWESKVIASHVAEFDIPTQPPAPPAHMTQQHHHPYPPHPIHIMQPHYAPAPYAAMQAPAQGIKAEPMDNRFMLQYAIPPLPGPSINGARPAAMPPHPGGQTGVLSFSRPQPIAQTALVRPYTPQVNNQSQQQAAPAPAPNAPAAPQVQAQQQQHKIPQVDGPSESSGDEDTPSPPGYAPRTSHPSLPQPSSSRDAAEDDSEAINSDLDDPDTENEEEAEEGGPGETDIVFCTYDKVARVKNKWKCVLKDGMVHVNNRDYLFSKCTGEFEW